MPSETSFMRPRSRRSHPRRRLSDSCHNRWVVCVARVLRSRLTSYVPTCSQNGPARARTWDLPIMRPARNGPECGEFRYGCRIHVVETHMVLGIIRGIPTFKLVRKLRQPLTGSGRSSRTALSSPLPRAQAGSEAPSLPGPGGPGSPDRSSRRTSPRHPSGRSPGGPIRRRC